MAATNYAISLPLCFIPFLLCVPISLSFVSYFPSLSSLLGFIFVITNPLYSHFHLHLFIPRSAAPVLAANIYDSCVCE